MTFDEFSELVISWAGDRKILQNGNPHTQALKLLSEFGELADGLAKNDQDEIKDAIGDCSVVCVILAAFEGERLQMNTFLAGSVVSAMALICDSTGSLLLKTASDKAGMDISIAAQEIVRFLSYIAGAQGLDYMDCCAHAWSEIKDRRGYLNELGVFVKEDANAQA